MNGCGRGSVSERTASNLIAWSALGSKPLMGNLLFLILEPMILSVIRTTRATEKILSDNLDLFSNSNGTSIERQSPHSYHNVLSDLISESGSDKKSKPLSATDFAQPSPLKIKTCILGQLRYIEQNKYL